MEHDSIHINRLIYTHKLHTRAYTHTYINTCICYLYIFGKIKIPRKPPTIIIIVVSKFVMYRL